MKEYFNKTAGGTALVLIGTVSGLFLSFVSITIAARVLSKSDYGVFFLGFTVFNIAVVIASLGLPDGIARYIGFYKGKKIRPENIIFTSILVSLAFSILLASLIFYFSEGISGIFHTQKLSVVLRIFSLAVPFFVLLNVVASIFRGFGNVRFKVIFLDLIPNTLRVPLIVIVALLFPTLLYMTSFFALPIILSFILSLYYRAYQYHFLE